MDDYARLDDMLSKSQRDIGESSNLAQIAQTYACNFSDSKYTDYVCILSVLAQVAIDNAKRRFDIDLTEEIRRIKNDMDITQHKYPDFWKLIRRDMNPDNINSNLRCPMNCLYDLELNKFRHNSPTLSMSYFFRKHPLEENRVKCKKIEDLITNYSLELYNQTVSTDLQQEFSLETHLLLRSDFESLLNTINSMKIPQKYVGVLSWLIDRAFMITPQIYSNTAKIKTKTNKNKALLLKVLYTTSPKAFLACFKSE